MPPASELPPNIAPHDPYGAFRIREFRAYSIGNFISVIGRQMLGVAVGYEVFQRTHSATALGLVGLAGALPIILLALPAGQIADRFHRRNIIIFTQFLSIFTSLGLAWFASQPPIQNAGATRQWSAAWLESVSRLFGDSNPRFGPEIPIIFGLLTLNGIARTFGWAARAPFIANIVPRSTLGNAVTWNSSLFEIGSMAGPALGGILVAYFGFSLVYLLEATGSLIFIGFLATIRVHQEQAVAPEHPVQDLFSGIKFVYRTKVILAAITLDLFAVLLGGATALLPMFADDILQVGAVGLGWLRAAPSFGAVLMAVLLAHMPPMRRAGITLLASVAGFGVAMVVFGLSKSFWISLVALAISGALDNVSVVVRHTLVQLLTPDAMRGRVAAVNNIFIGSSNELGAFESGVTAALVGPVISVVAGGIGTVLVVFGVAAKWPEVRKIGNLAAIPAPAESDAELEV